MQKKITKHSIFLFTITAFLLCSLYLDAQPLDTSTTSNKGIPVEWNKVDFCNCPETFEARQVTARDTSTASIATYRNSREFQYERTVSDEARSFWERLLEKILRKIFGNMDNETQHTTWLFIRWIIAILGILIVMYWLYRSEFYGGPLRRSTKINDGSIITETERSEEDITEQIGKALDAKDLPLAIRWTYIRTIKHLALRNKLELRQDKTNQDYYYEIKDQNVQKLFLNLTNVYEYTNYGKFETTMGHYTEAEGLATTILQS